jgi:hypothetical protein
MTFVKALISLSSPHALLASARSPMSDAEVVFVLPIQVRPS